MSTASRMACLCIGTEPVFAIIGDAEQLKLFVCRWPERVFSVKLRIPYPCVQLKLEWIGGPEKDWVRVMIVVGQLYTEFGTL